jgi:MFS family permease
LAAVLTLHANPAQMGLLGASQFLPALLFGLPAGVWLDRTRRQPVLVAAQLVNMAALATVPAAALLQVLSLPQLYAVGFVVGSANSVYNIAQNAFLPTLAGRENLVEANAKYQTSMTVASLAGPGLAGFLVQVLTAPMAIAFDAASFLVGAVTTAWIRVSEPPSAPATSQRHLVREAADGLTFLWTHPLVRSITLSIISANMGGRLSGAVFLLLFVNHLGVTPTQVGIAFAAGSLSSLVGAQVTKPLIERGRLGSVMVAGAGLFSFGVALAVPAALAPRPWIFPILVASGVISGFGLMAYNINQQAIRGSVIPNQVLGRVSAGLFVVVAVGNVAGALIGGALGQTLGLFWALVVATAVSATAVLPALFSPLRSLRAVPTPE